MCSGERMEKRRCSFKNGGIIGSVVLGHGCLMQEEGINVICCCCCGSGGGGGG